MDPFDNYSLLEDGTNQPSSPLGSPYSQHWSGHPSPTTTLFFHTGEGLLLDTTNTDEMTSNNALDSKDGMEELHSTTHLTSCLSSNQQPQSKRKLEEMTSQQIPISVDSTYVADPIHKRSKLDNGAQFDHNKALKSTTLSLNKEGNADTSSRKVSKYGKKLCAVGVLHTFVICYRYPNHGTLSKSTKSIPKIPVSIRDNLHDTRLIFLLYDGQNKDFGRLHTDAARFLREALDDCPGFSLNSLRLYLRERPLDAKESKKSPNDLFEKALRFDIHLNVRRDVAEDILALIAKLKLKLSPPTASIEHYKPGLTELEEQIELLDANHCSEAFFEKVDQHADDVAQFLKASNGGLPELEPPNSVITQLYTHQKQALWFMREREKIPPFQNMVDELNLWETIYVNNDDIRYYNKVTGTETTNFPTPILGGVLADDMGLGKTVTMLSHVASTMPEAVVFANRPHKVIDGKICKHIKATLVVMKLSLLENTWVPEIEKHFNPETLSFCKFHGPDRSQLDLSQHDIILTTYEVLRYEFKQRSKSSSIYNYEWFRIILDEAHEIRNYSSQGAMACRAVNAERRWAMSGTPFQNSFDDIGSLMAFLQVVPINRPQAFTKYITAPIMSRDTYGFWAWEILRDSLFLRRTKDSLSLGLPKKEEIIIKLRFEPKEQDIHDRLFKNYSKQLQKLQDKLQDRLGNKIYMNALTIFVKMRRFCAHKQELLGAEELKIMEDALNTEEDDADQGSTRFNKEAALDLLYVSYSGEADHCVRCRQSVCHSVDNNDENASSQILCHVLPPDCWRILCDPCFEEYKNSVKALPGNKNKIVACDICMKTHSINTIKISRKDWQNCLSRHTLINSNSRLAKARGAYTGPSVKVKYLLQHLEQLKMLEAAHPEEDPVKTVVFSTWTGHLDQIEIAFQNNNIQYTRLDGSISAKNRTLAIRSFRENPEVKVFLITTEAGGVGLNLVEANYVFMMEPQYNPQKDQQAIDRVHRIGQKRKVIVTRLIIEGSIEERVQIIANRKARLGALCLSKSMTHKERKRECDQILEEFGVKIRTDKTETEKK